MKSSLSKGISLRNSKRRRRSLGKRRYNELEDKKDYLTKYNIKYETIETKVKEKKKPKIRSIKITSVPKESSKKEDIDLLALLDDNVFKKEEKKESLEKSLLKEEPSPKEDIADLSDFDDTAEDNSPEENVSKEDKVKQEGGYDPNVKKIFVQNVIPDPDKGKLIL